MDVRRIYLCAGEDRRRKREEKSAPKSVAIGRAEVITKLVVVVVAAAVSLLQHHVLDFGRSSRRTVYKHKATAYCILYISKRVVIRRRLVRLCHPTYTSSSVYFSYHCVEPL